MRMITAAAVLLFLASCSGKAIYTAGTYTGEGEGHGGTIKLSVTVSDKKITGIEVTENPESAFSLTPMQTIMQQAVDTNSGELDAVSGATESSHGMITAIQDALSKASASVE